MPGTRWRLKVYRLGDRAGNGSKVKIINQLLAGVHIAAAAEAMALGLREGVDAAALYDVITHSAGNSWMFENRMAHVLANDYTPLSAVDIFVKDLGLVLDTARATKFPLPLASTAHQMFMQASTAKLSQGRRCRGDQDLPLFGNLRAPRNGVRAPPGRPKARAPPRGQGAAAQAASVGTPIRRLGCIADDFTGATDLANNLVRAGMRVVQLIGVPSRRRRSTGVDAVVVALKSRTIARRGRGPVAAALRWLKAGARPRSTSRSARPSTRRRAATSGRCAKRCGSARRRFMIVTPAFPENGRTMYKGHLFVGEVPLPKRACVTIR